MLTKEEKPCGFSPILVCLWLYISTAAVLPSGILSLSSSCCFCLFSFLSGSSLCLLSGSDLLSLLLLRQLLEAVDRACRSDRCAEYAALALALVYPCEVILNMDSVKVADCGALHAADACIVAVLAGNSALVCG